MGDIPENNREVLWKTTDGKQNGTSFKTVEDISVNCFRQNSEEISYDKNVAENRLWCYQILNRIFLLEAMLKIYRFELKLNFYRSLGCSIYSRYYAEACNGWRDPSPRLSVGQHSSEETSQRWRAFEDSAYDFFGPGIEPQTSCTDSNIATVLPVHQPPASRDF